MQKRGELSNLTVGILISVLIIALSIVIFFVVKDLKDVESGNVLVENLDLKISQVKTVDDKTLNVTVKRNFGEGEFDSLSFVVDDGSTIEVVKKSSFMKENESQEFSLNFILINASKIKRISITPVFIKGNGEEIIGEIQDEYITPNTCSNYCPDEAQCGFNDCGMQCGSGCNSGYLCLNYKCIKQQSSSGGGGSSGGSSDSSDDTSEDEEDNQQNETVCTPTTCLALQRTCGTVSNGCGGTLNCGTCGTGYICQYNGTCMKEIVIDCGDVSCKSGEYCFNGVCLLNVSGNTYFVATNGNDNNPGTFEQPFLSWGKAFRTAQAGDITYFRGGIYYSASDKVGGERDFNKGSEGNYIRFFNYPNETPVLDCSLHNTSLSYYNKGIAMWNTEYIHMKGLHVRNVYQGRLDVNVEGISAWRVGNIIFEELVIYNVDGEGFVVSNYSDTILVKNCDSYNLNDALRTAIYPAPGSAGQNGAGFQYGNGGSYGEAAINSRIYFQGCRAWNFSDNGFAGSSVGYAEFDSCWAFDGGMLSGEGCGFKYASLYGGDENNLPLARVIKNSIGAFNGGYGFSPNNREDVPLNGKYYNNFAYHNGYKGTGHGLGHGFVILNYAGTEPKPNEMYSNNLAYDNELGEIYEGDNYIHEYNSWDLLINISDNDFESLNISEMKKPRKLDGNLPDISFGKLKQGSDLIDAGIVIPGYHCSTSGYHEGCSVWYGAAPDLGFFESNY